MSRRLSTVALTAIATIIIVGLAVAGLVRFTPVNITIGDRAQVASVAAPSVAPSVSPQPTLTPAPEPRVTIDAVVPTEGTLADAGFIPVKVQLLGAKPTNVVLAADALLPLHDTLNDYLHTGQPSVPNALTQNYLTDTALEPAERAYKLKAWSLPNTSGLVVYTNVLTKKAVLVTYTLGDFQPMAYSGIESATARQLAHPSFRAQLTQKLAADLVMGGGFNTLDPFTDGFVASANLS